MIGSVSGTVESVQSDAALVDVGGIGYEIRMPSADLSALHSGQHTKIFTSMNVSQDAITLYGFLTLASKKMFIQLQKVSGIGPKVALSLLSTLPADKLAQSVADGDATALAKAPGLGKKGAQKIILELKGSVDLSDITPSTATRLNIDSGTLRVIEGLVSLGWRQIDAQSAVEQVCSQDGIPTPLTEADVPKVLRLALASLDRGRRG